MAQLRRHWPWALGAVAVLAAAWVVLGRQSGEGDNGLLLAPADAATIAEGRKIYDANCATCHGADLGGQPDWQQRLPNGRLPASPHDVSGHTWHHDERFLFEITKYGVQKFAGRDYQTDMPAYEGVLSDREIVAVLSYIKSRWPADLRSKHDEMSLTAARR